MLVGALLLTNRCTHGHLCRCNLRRSRGRNIHPQSDISFVNTGCSVDIAMVHIKQRNTSVWSSLLTYNVGYYPQSEFKLFYSNKKHWLGYIPWAKPAVIHICD